MTQISSPHVLLVHGAYADASSWSAVLRNLLRRDIDVTAVQLRLQTLADDAAVVRHQLDLIGGPTLVVAHSYGGAVITSTDYAGTAVTGLVYVAAYAPDLGQSVLSLNAEGQSLPSQQPPNVVVDEQAGQLSLSRDGFVRYFAPDLLELDARVLAAAQRPVGFGAGGAPATQAAWRDFPTWYQISADDQIIDPALEERFADAMPQLKEKLVLASSHASLLSHADEVTDLILRAAGAA